MGDYIEIQFENVSTEQKEIVIALLSELNYEGFEESDDSLKAFIPVDEYNEEELTTLTKEHKLSFSALKIDNKNWNEEWESNFHPVIIPHLANNTPWVAIRAGFHPLIKNVDHEIIITPKMSFGTGHHATTSMMMKMMSELNLTGKSVLDFGTGTGVLAILSEKLAASKIIAIDNDDWSIENAIENFELNHCSKIKLLKTSTADVDNKFDFILANIVKMVILDNLTAFTKQLVEGGTVLLSGLLSDDEPDVLNAATENHLILKKKIEEKNWVCLQLVYKPAAI